MPILNIQSSQTGLVGTLPSIAYINTSDTESQILASGYLNQSVASGLASFSLPCMACVTTVASAGAQPSVGWYNVSYTTTSGSPVSAIWSLTAITEPGSAVLPTVSGQLAMFSDVDGTIENSNIVASNVQISALTNPDVISDLIWVDVVLGQAALASSGHVTIQASSGSKQYVVRDIRMNYGAAGLSGGGGNRLVTVTDGTTVWNNAGLTASLLGTPINTVWGGTGNPLAGTVAMNTASVAGSPIYAVYSGGTTDYTAGSVTISVLVQRTA